MNEPRIRLAGEEPDLFISTGSRDGEAVRLLNELFWEAANQGASDIHLEDEMGESRIRYRVQGAMYERGRVSRALAVDMQTKIRMRAKLSLADVRRPLDGRFGLHYARPGEEGEETLLRLDIRVSFQPTVYGQSVVMRLLDQRNTTKRLDEIEMANAVRDWINILVREPHGLFLVTGPTGSGKTTTLYGILNELNDDTRKIVTIEDPVEYRVPGLIQTSIEAGLTFSEVLRETLRQDPDIILVGEIRDAETAAIAVQAAMTGHLVLSTLHANDACQTAVRMLDLGVDPNTLGAALRGVLAQRLVRRLHEERMTMREPTDFERRWLNNNKASAEDADEIFGAPLDEADPNSAYDGRLAVMELLVVDRFVRNVLPLRDARLIRSVAQSQPQYRTLAQAAADLSRRGFTSLTEVLGITSVAEVANAARNLGERLVEMGRITPYQLDVAKELIDEASQRGEVVSLETVLIRARFCTRKDLDEATAL